MIQINLIYANGARLTTETVSVAELLTALKAVPNPDVTAVLLLDEPGQGRLPVKLDGLFLEPAVSAEFFQLSRRVTA